MHDVRVCVCVRDVRVCCTVQKAEVPVSVRQLLQMFCDGDLMEEKKHTFRWKDCNSI